MDIGPGSSLGAYRIVEQLGRGGMSTVYKAYHAPLDRYVAIKVVSPSISQDPGFRERFAQEARTVAHLRHPNILTMYDYGEESGQAYLITELIEGGTLAERVGAPWPPNLAAGLVRSVALALDYAHDQGVLHRDVKPSNILLRPDGSPVLADFGIAKLTGATSGLTGTGSILGTPTYQAPEQANGDPVTGATDQYALGIVAYEMLAGRAPFDERTPVATLMAHLVKPLPSPRALNPALSERIEEVLGKALAKQPEQRYRRVSAFAAALAEAAAQLPATVAPVAASIVLEPTLADAATPIRLQEPPAIERTMLAMDGAAGALILEPSPAPKLAAQSDSRLRLIIAGAVACALLIGVVLFATRPRSESIAGVTSTALGASSSAAISATPQVTATSMSFVAAPSSVATEVQAAAPTSVATVATPLTMAPNLADAWVATSRQLDPIWLHDWPRAIALLDAFRASYPDYPVAIDKLYVALYAYGLQLRDSGDAAGAAMQFARAEALSPTRPEVPTAAAALTPTATPPPVPTSTPTPYRSQLAIPVAVQPTASSTPSSLYVATPTASPAATATALATSPPTPVPSATATATAAVVVAPSPTPIPTHTEAPKPTATHTPGPTATATRTPQVLPTGTPRVLVTSTPRPPLPVAPLPGPSRLASGNP